MPDFVQGHEALFWWMAAIGLATFIGSLVALPIVVVRMPADYFVDDRPRRERWKTQHPALRWTLIGLKNALGVVLVIAGVAMLVLPGQGLLCILVGVMLVDFPGKRRVELWFIRKRSIHRAIDWLRRRRGKEPLRLPDGVRHG